MTPEQRTRAIVHNAADRALSSRGHWVPLSVRVAITETVLAALAEQGYAIVPISSDALLAVMTDRIEHRVADNYREPDGSPLQVDPRAVAVIAAPAALAAIVSATAPQPSEAPQDAQTADGGISGRSDTPNASTGLSDARAEEAEEALDSAQQALARVVQHARDLAGYRPVEADALAAVILGLDPRHCRPGAALALLEQEAWTRG